MIAAFLIGFAVGVLAVLAWAWTEPERPAQGIGFIRCRKARQASQGNATRVTGPWSDPQATDARPAFLGPFKA